MDEKKRTEHLPDELLDAAVGGIKTCKEASGDWTILSRDGKTVFQSGVKEKDLQDLVSMWRTYERGTSSPQEAKQKKWEEDMITSGQMTSAEVVRRFYSDK